MKRFLTVPVMVLTVLCVLVLAGCHMGPSAEEQIREKLTQEFDELKDGASDDLIESMAESADGSFDELGIDEEKFAAAFLDGFDYTIGDITLNEKGDQATADVTIKNKTFADIINSFQAKFQEKLATLDFETLSSEEELMQIGGEVLMQAVKDAESTEHAMELQYNLQDNTWTPDESVFNDQLNKALMG